jgi:hypothetical protein
MGTSEVLERKKTRRLSHTVSCQITIERAVKRIFSSYDLIHMLLKIFLSN